MNYEQKLRKTLLGISAKDMCAYIDHQALEGGYHIPTENDAIESLMALIYGEHSDFKVKGPYVQQRAWWSFWRERCLALYNCQVIALSSDSGCFW